MDYVNFGSTGVQVSQLSLGTMLFGSTCAENDAIKLTHRAISDGINVIDTANGYNNGLSEEIVGKALDGYRNDVVLITKVNAKMGNGVNDGGLSRFHILKEVENSLKRLNTDHIDIYFIHRRDNNTPLEETILAMDQLVQSGKVRYIGISNHKAWEICNSIMFSELNNLDSVACIQDLYNIVDRDVEVELLPFTENFNLGFMAYSPLGRGMLTGKYLVNQKPPKDSRAGRGDIRILESGMRQHSMEVAQSLKPIAEKYGKSVSQLAVNWVLENPIVSTAIIGPRTIEQYEDNLGSLGWNINLEHSELIDQLVPPGEHTGFGFNDPANPVLGRP